ncbi:MAG: type I DNA topoisomerase [Candidatus Marinimicrobia bacterium]|nr:type I DNA topoisomerase [Candidatus Neomarinimicrobiota bacterium]
MANKNTKLVIVESPSKIKTLKKFLGDDYIIEASVGHICDLSKKDMGIDIENGFTPTYEVSPDSKKVVSNLKKVLKNVDELYLATDPDREGEAISWHLIEQLKPKVPVKRLVFNEITKTAILEAFEDTRELDLSLFKAQETRRILDRLFGFMVSKKLWFNVKGGLSAGRVQSPAVKILVDREKERSKFIESEYWSVSADFSSKGESFSALLNYIGTERVATGKSFEKETGELVQKNTVALDKEGAEKLAHALKSHEWNVASLEQKPGTQNPYAPFKTTKLIREGVNKLRMSSQQVMRVAQRLYENGYITYMRTDSVNLSNEAISAARNAISSMYGDEYMPKSPRQYKSKVKNAQEAHEAIRPAGSTFILPDELKPKLEDNEYKLYDLIWKRTVASQMSSAKLQKTSVVISDGEHKFSASGKIIEFPGFMRAYVEGADDPDAQLDDKEKKLPQMAEGDSLGCETVDAKQHFTKPANRFTEASLVKELEALGIGRPSTYASIMKRIQDKGYVNRVKGAMIPTFTGYAVIQFLEKYFDELVDLQYTSQMEDILDEISTGETDSGKFLDGFYFGTDKNHPGLEADLEQEFDKESSKEIMTVVDNEGIPIQIKIGRYGLYIQKGETRATILDTIPPSELDSDYIINLLEKKESGPEELGVFPETDEPIYLKVGRYGPYIQMGKKMKSLLPGMKEEDVTPEIALAIISLPKTIGTWPENEKEIKADIGRFGPYIKCEKETRSIPASINLLEITEEQACELLATKRKGATSVLREFGDGIELKDGRYGAYVTDGKINATLPKTISTDDVTLEIAVKLIAEKKAKGPTKKFRKKKAK